MPQPFARGRAQTRDAALSCTGMQVWLSLASDTGDAGAAPTPLRPHGPAAAPLRHSCAPTVRRASTAWSKGVANTQIEAGGGTWDVTRRAGTGRKISQCTA